jgi:transcriptional regulator with PAS, ATPase and Fis domain
VAIDCGAIPENLIESELFGHVRGAFSGAVGDRKGVFEEAEGGTLFFDEIGELPLTLQPKLLRALESREIRRLGGSDTIRCDLRIIAATNRDLRAEVNRGTFRADLYFRLNIVRFEIPPLRERREDIPLLARNFVEEFNRQDNRQVRGLSSEAEKELERYHWPGNVRELRNVIQRAVVLSGTGLIEMEHLPDTVLRATAPAPAPSSGGGSSITPIREMERDMILRALEETGQDKRRAAQLLGISLKTLYNKLAKYGIQAVKSARLT